MNFKKTVNFTGLAVLIISFIVFFLSAERSGSLWDCGEFIAGAYKLQVVHPPGAPFFILVGRMFTLIAELLSDNPKNIAFAVNLMSGLCTALLAMFMAWVAMILAKMALKGRDTEPSNSDNIALAFTGLTAGLTAAFASSVWFSAVEGEVYAMSNFFTALVVWLAVKWFHLPDEKEHDKLLVLAIYSIGLSAGVHLLSLLTLPVITLLYYFKKREKHTLKGMLIFAAIGIVLVGIIQKVIISGIPYLWSKLELITVNGLGMPIHSGLIPLFIIIFGLLFIGLRYAKKLNDYRIQMILVSLGLVVVSYMSFGVVLIRANADTPINMNNPDDAFRLLPYLNREQYGERPLMFGPDYYVQPSGSNSEDRYGRVGDRYEIVDRKMSYEYNNADKRLFPRLGHNTLNRPALYEQWLGLRKGEKPTGIDNLRFFFNYQIGWMYVRYFMWNFVGRQNGQQGYYDWDSSSGNWESGISFIDEIFLHNLDQEPSFLKDNPGKNHYFFIPLILGILGLIWHYRNSREGFIGLLSLFIILGLGIIVYTNQPPSEPRERDYVLAGSFFIFAVWVGMGAMALYRWLGEKLQNYQTGSLVSVIALAAPIIMLTQNFDDHSRRNLSGAVDYATNFLESCDENAIIFTYGDNDTYPLWYAQEVEGVRTDVRVVNLSLLQVDWYINQLRRKVNDSPPIKMSVSADAIRGYKRNQIPINPSENPMPIDRIMQYIAEDHPKSFGNGITVESIVPTKRLFIPVNRNELLNNGVISIQDTAYLQSSININLNKSSILKDDLAMLDIIANNFGERPIYWAVTVRPEKTQGLNKYLEQEGLGLKLTPLVRNVDDGYDRYGIYGMGYMDADRTLEVIKNSWKWGGFDKYDLYVDDSFGPSIQSMRMVFSRAVDNFVMNKEMKKAEELIDIYFEAFPNKNFPFDHSILSFVVAYFDAGSTEKGKEILLQLAENNKEWKDFINSLDPSEIKSSYSLENDIYVDRLPRQLLGIAAKYSDDDFTKTIEQILQ